MEPAFFAWLAFFADHRHLMGRGLKMGIPTTTAAAIRDDQSSFWFHQIAKQLAALSIIHHCTSRNWDQQVSAERPVIFCFAPFPPSWARNLDFCRKAQRVRLGGALQNHIAALPPISAIRSAAWTYFSRRKWTAPSPPLPE